jgi:hypothetical protein
MLHTDEKKRKGRFLIFIKRRFLVFLFFALTALLIFGGVVMQLWNAILPRISAVKNISYWQAVGLLALCKILFGQFHPGGYRRPQRGAPQMHPRERWMSMNEDEKEKFREQWKKRCAGRRDKGSGS